MPSKAADLPTFNYKCEEVPRYLMHLPDRVSDSYIGKTVFITGGSGFLGKVIIEKLLRKCPNIGRIYLLMRPKKGKEPKQRLDDLFSSPLFDLLKEKQGAKIFEKVSVISGDVTEIDLGISPEDRDLLCKTVNIVYHVAATIRFDEPLKKAVILNTRGTKFMLDLARQMKQLEVFVHVSTAYCHLQEKILDEKPYPPPQDPHKIIKCCELMDEDVIESVGEKLLRNFPNTYAFTKSLGEGLVNEAIQEGLPCVMVRPSVVIPTWLEPIPGWTDNLNGPAGLLIAAGKGVLRTMYCDNQGYADFVPVDICVNAIILAEFCFRVIKKEDRIYNITTSSEWQLTWQEIIDLGKEIVTTKIPLNGCVWYPGGSMKRSKLIHNICVILFHMIPAYFLDGIIFLSGNKPILLRVHDRINKGFEVFEYYANNQWHFKNDKAVSVRNHLNERERIEYKIDGINMDIRKYFEDMILGARKYLLKEDPSTIPSSRLQMKVMYWVDVIARALLTFFLLWFVYTYSGSFANIFVTLFQLVEHILSFFTTDSSSSTSLPIKADL